MPLDREDTLKKAEKLLRQGRLDAAIAEYLRVVEDQPRDWNTANTLGDLYVRANQADKAVAQYARIADHFFQDGFYPKAAALYKKILKIVPDDEQSQLHLADISVKLGLLADAKSYLTAVAARRRARRRHARRQRDRRPSGDDRSRRHRGAAGGRTRPRGVRRRSGRRGAVPGSLRRSAREGARGRGAAGAAGGRAVQSRRSRERARILAKAAVAAGDFQAARGYLDRETAGQDPALLMALVDIELRSGQLEQAARDPAAAVRDRPGAAPQDRRARLGAVRARTRRPPSSASTRRSMRRSSASEFDDAASILQEFVTRVPTHVPALLKLVEICVDGGLEATMYEAQAQLADAYLSASRRPKRGSSPKISSPGSRGRPRTSNGFAARSSCCACPSRTRSSRSG